MKIKVYKNQMRICYFHDGDDYSPACLLKFIHDWSNFNCGGLIKNMNKRNCPLIKHKQIIVELENE